MAGMATPHNVCVVPSRGDDVGGAGLAVSPGRAHQDVDCAAAVLIAGGGDGVAGVAAARAGEQGRGLRCKGGKGEGGDGRNGRDI